MSVNRPLTGGHVRAPLQSRPFRFVRNAILMGDDLQECIGNMSRKPVKGHTREDVRQQAALIVIGFLDEWLANEDLQAKYTLRQHAISRTGYRLRDANRKARLWPDPIPEDESRYVFVAVDDEFYQQMLRLDLKEQVRGVITDLEWLAVEATVIDGLTYKATAKKVGVSVKSVKSARERAIRKLKEWYSRKNSRNAEGQIGG
jgi:DNA-directed RNA polymerase specialized sigma24 family protein